MHHDKQWETRQDMRETDKQAQSMPNNEKITNMQNTNDTNTWRTKEMTNM